jgi:ATP-dependent DNA helicase RecQ
MSVKKEYDLYGALKRFYGFDTFKGRQETIIKDVLNGNNVFVIMPTGGGKSLTYQLPALISEGVGIVISPLIALMKNQVDMLRASSSDEGIAHFMNSSLNRAEIEQVKSDLVNHKTKLLYVAPESLTKDETVEFLRTLKISLFAIDEAHCISEWGHDFRPEYRRIRPIIENIGQKVPIMALTATATLKVQTDIQKNLSILDATVYKDSFDRANLYYEVRPKTKNVIKDIIKYIKNNPGKSGIVYCLSRKKVEEVAELLQVNNIKALPYHAGLDSKTRKKNQEDFLMERVDVVVATIAFGMGIDKPDIRFVIHHDMPKSIESYYQETGRGGRDGGEGNCIAFYSYEDIQKLEKFSKDKSVAEKAVAKQLLFEMVSYAESSVCRHHQLLHYFGEEYTKESCDACDNCLHPKEKFEGMGYLKLLLQAIVESKEQLKAKGLTHFMVGKVTADVKAYKLDRMSLFGAGMEEDEKFWNAVIRQAMIHRLIEKDIEQYGVLKLMDKGREYINKPYSIMLAKDHDYENPTDEDFFAINSAKSTTADEILVSILKDVRRDIANREDIPPYVIFQDNSINEMAIQYPIVEEELLQISGVGVGKAKKYGEPFMNVIAKYVEDNDIIRPVDMVIKSPIRNSLSKVFIIQNIDRKLPLDELAQARNATMEELLIEMEKIVLSGTKIEIDYYIDNTIEDWHQEEIWDYFLDTEIDDLQEAFDDLVDDEITEDEVRMMRIKFLSEYGN